jgi:hypothetical protein
MGRLVGIVYGITDRRIRQIVTAGDVVPPGSPHGLEATLDAQILRADEAMLKIPLTFYQNHSSQDDLALDLGLTPESQVQKPSLFFVQPLPPDTG